MALAADGWNPPPMSEQQKDGLDRLFDTIEGMQGSIKMIAADTEGTREAVQVIRDRMTGYEERLAALERAENRHVEWRKSASDADAKIVSDQAAFVIALDETRTAAKEAVAIAKEALEVSKQSGTQVKEAVDASKQAYEAARLAFVSASKGLTAITHVKTNQETANTDLAAIKTEEQKKPKVPVALAATLNLAVGLVYVILELLRRAGH